MIIPLIVTVLLLALILLSLEIFIALGVAGAVGLFLFRRPDALALIGTSFFRRAPRFVFQNKNPEKIT